MIDDSTAGAFTIMCDNCSNEIEVEANAWCDMIDEIKAEGWRTYKNGDHWLQKCPVCVREWAKTNAGKKRKV